MEASEIIIWTFTATGSFVGIWALFSPPNGLPARKRKAPRPVRRG